MFPVIMGSFINYERKTRYVMLGTPCSLHCSHSPRGGRRKRVSPQAQPAQPALLLVTDVLNFEKEGKRTEELKNRSMPNSHVQTFLKRRVSY